MAERKRRGRGEGSIFKRKDGLWCASVSAGYNSTGRRRRRTVYGKTKTEVKEKLREVELEGLIETTRVTVGEFLTRWLDMSVKPSLATATYVRYKSVIEGHIKPHIGGMRLGKLEPVHVEQLYAAQAKAGTSLRNQELSGIILGKALKTAVRLKLIKNNPARDVDKPRPDKKEMKVWTKAQTAAFLKAAETDRLYAMYVLAIATGLREGELFALEWTDVDFAGAAVTVQRTLEDIDGHIRVKEPKTRKSRRRVDLPQFAVDALHEHRKAMLAEGHSHCPVFCDTTGGYLRRQNILRRSLRPLVAKANKAAEETAAKTGAAPEVLPSIRFHDLRHTAATLLLLAGENPKVVSERLGHATIAITLDTYSHVLPTMGKEAAAKLDKLFG